MQEPIKVIDLFAGPGGLGEGFSSLHESGKRLFRIGASVEKEHSAHATLTLRAFFRQFPVGEAPDDYYAYLRGEIDRETLFQRWPEQYAAAYTETLGGPKTLGEDNTEIDRAIKQCLGMDRKWVLIGGPPCQAYSLVGRARNRGIEGYRAENDHRHFLYREYLRIIAKFNPAIFVMENVKGMLSSRVNGEPVFARIMADLQQPHQAVKEAQSKSRYHVYSFTTQGDDLFGGDLKPRDFVIRAEEYGIPQTRHRVILLGVRDDLNPERKQALLHPQPEISLREVIGQFPPLRSGLSRTRDGAGRWLHVVRNAALEIAQELGNSSPEDEIASLSKEVSQSIQLPKLDRGASFIDFSRCPQPYENMPAHLANWFRDDRLHGYLNHETRGHIKEDLARYLFCAAFASASASGRVKSPRLHDFPAYLLPDHANASSGKFVDRFKVQLPDRPASTITSHISKDGHYFVHYDLRQCRSLTVREAARVQTFPDNYKFEGSRTQQYVQVGNAVPPFLANHLAHIVFKFIKR